MENEGKVIPIRPAPYNLSRQAAEELIYAFGATPMRLCNGSCHYDRRGFHAGQILFAGEDDAGLCRRHRAMPHQTRPAAAHA